MQRSSRRARLTITRMLMDTVVWQYLLNNKANLKLLLNLLCLSGLVYMSNPNGFSQHNHLCIYIYVHSILSLSCAMLIHDGPLVYSNPQIS